MINKSSNQLNKGKKKINANISVSDFMNFPLTVLSGISSLRAEIFKKMNINTIRDLLMTLPSSYENWQDIRPLDLCNPDEEACLILRLNERCSGLKAISQKQRYLVNVNKPVVVNMVDLLSGINIEICYFNNYYAPSLLKNKRKYIFRGKITYQEKFRKFVMINPLYIDKGDLQEDENVDITLLKNTLPINANYKTYKGLSQNIIRKAYIQVFSIISDNLVLNRWHESDFDILPSELRCELNLRNILYYWQNIHCCSLKKSDVNFNNILELREEARKYFALEELFFFKLALLSISTSKKACANLQYPDDDSSLKQYLKRYLSSLPYSLTVGQKKACTDILYDFSSQLAANRLIQGDVGSGKTTVACIALLICVYLGKQALFMAPTSVLATQIYETVFNSFNKFDQNIKLALLLSEQKSSYQRKIKEDFNKGETDILIGTTSLLNSEISSENLALVITDEQHRFGVNQRLHLSRDKQAHVLSMSATPIPRSLAMVLYGKASVSEIRELPSNRPDKPTFTVSSADLPRVFDLFSRELQNGNQIYIICPLKEENDNIEPSSSLNKINLEIYDLNKVSEILKRHPLLSKYRHGILHGSLKADEKDRIMREFYDGKLDILISTTVVEVGINNPKANIMLIMNAERFGLAQLHQLRGRIGRLNKKILEEKRQKVVCILHSDHKGEIAKERLKAMCHIQDGFTLASEDLKLRGPGNFFGTQQHGLPELKFANLYEDLNLLTQLSSVLEDLLNNKVLNLNDLWNKYENILFMKFGDYYTKPIL